MEAWATVKFKPYLSKLFFCSVHTPQIDHIKKGQLIASLLFPLCACAYIYVCACIPVEDTCPLFQLVCFFLNVVHLHFFTFSTCFPSFLQVLSCHLSVLQSNITLWPDQWFTVLLCPGTWNMINDANDNDHEKGLHTQPGDHNAFPLYRII